MSEKQPFILEGGFTEAEVLGKIGSTLCGGIVADKVRDFLGYRLTGHSEIVSFPVRLEI